MNNTEKMLNIFKEKPYTIRMGSGKLAKMYKMTVGEVKDARNMYYAKSEVKTEKLKIAILDIETSPMQAYVWSRWKQNIYLDQTISEWFILCWSIRWLGGELVSNRLTGQEAVAENDKRICAHLWEELRKADLVVVHNGINFDIPKINSRMVVNNLPPLRPFQVIDTYKIVSKQFGFSSNKLDALARFFGFDPKLETNFELWRDCVGGDEKALQYMETYNNKDVDVLLDVFIKLLPYMRNLPNLAIYFEEDIKACTVCSSNDLVEDGFYYTRAGKYPLYRCKVCGALSRGRYSEFKGDKKQLLTTI